MSTTFYDKDGVEVAHRYWGGAMCGVAIELRPGAADVSMTTPLRGEDGSQESLESLAREVGKGRRFKFSELIQKIEEIIPSAEICRDNANQIVIYTSLIEDDDGELSEFEG